MDKTRILITGANGFIGRNIARYFDNRQYVVYGCGRTATEWTNGRYFTCDLAKNQISDIEVDIVIHAAGACPVSGISFQEYFDNNVVATMNILEYAKKQNIDRIIYFGSLSSFGTTNKELNENSPHNNLDDYGMTKYVAEKLIKDSGIPYYILILPSVIGSDCNDGWIVRMARAISNVENVTYYNGTETFNSILEIQDLCMFIEKILNDKLNDSESYLLGNKGITTIEEIAAFFKNRFASSSKVKNICKGGNAVYLNIDKAVKRGFDCKSIDNILEIVCQKVIAETRL